MAFKTLNKNFIYHELIRPMRDLNSLEKVELYKLIQAETRIRLRKSYEQSHSDKEQFYLDAFDVLGEYEGDYIIMNLLIESQWFSLYKKLLLNMKENRETFKFNNEITAFLESIESERSRRGDLDQVEEKRIALKHILIFLEDLDESNKSFVKDFFSFNAGSNQIIKSFVNTLVDERRQNDEKFWIFLLFNKIWKEYYLDRSLQSVRGAVFYRELSKYVETEKVAIEHLKFLDFVNSKLADNFVYMEYSPFHLDVLDFKDSIQMKRFHLEYQNRISEVKEIIRLSDESTFMDILKYVEERQMFDQRTTSILQNKILQFQYPDSKELGYFKKLYEKYGDSNKEAKKIVKSLYLFELI